MTDSIYIEQITFYLHAYASSVKTLGRLNLHDINVHSENFFRDFLNKLRGLNLVNANDLWRNEAGIDLVDFSQKLIIQVSSECTKKKIQDSLDKADKVKYNGFHFLFLSVVASADNLRDKDFMVPSVFTFAPTVDILDIDGIISEVNSKVIEEKKYLFELVHNHMHCILEPQKNPTTLSKVVEALDKASNSSDSPIQDVPFIIPLKIELNHLEDVSGAINDNVIYTRMLNNVYSTCELLGKMTRTKIHSVLRRCYDDNKGKLSPSELYRYIEDFAFNMVMNSSNRPADMTLEDIRWAVSVVVADAFEECKIFEHPQNLI